MVSKLSFLPRLSLARDDKNPTLPAHGLGRYASPRSNPSEYHLNELSPRENNGLFSPNFHDNSSHSTGTTYLSKMCNRKPTDAPNKRPSSSSSFVGSASKIHLTNERILFTAPPPPIAVARESYRDVNIQQGHVNNEDEESNRAEFGASWLPGTARRVISSVIWDGNNSRSTQEQNRWLISYGRNSIWRQLARRERAIVANLQHFLQVQEERLAGGSQGRSGADSRSSANASRAGSMTPTGTRSPSVVSSPHPGRSVSFLEPVTRSGPGGEVTAAWQPQKNMLGINGARKGFSRSMVELADLKAEEDASLSFALATRKQALADLRRLATRRDEITEKLRVLEADEDDPLAQELEDLDCEHRGVGGEIQELEERLAGLKAWRRVLEGTMDDLKNRREAGLSGYKKALKEVEISVTGFLTQPPVGPLDIAGFAENATKQEQPASTGGVEFMELRPGRRTIAKAREWWESEVGVLEKRKAEVDTERAALEEGVQIWEEVVNLVLAFEADLRQLIQVTQASTTDVKSKERENTPSEALKLQYEKICDVIVGLGQRLTLSEERGWNLLIAAIGAELEAFREAARVNRQMLQALENPLDEQRVPASRALNATREDSGTTDSQNSFHTGNGGSMVAVPMLDLLDKNVDETDESEHKPHHLVATHDEVVHPDDSVYGDATVEGNESALLDAELHSLEREDSENEVPPEFLVEHHGVNA